MTDLRLAIAPAESLGEPARVRAVQQRMATAVLPPLPPVALGDVRLMSHQRHAAARLLRILQRHGGALLADDVGLGKTFTALAVTRHYAHVHILAPAGLLPMWQAAVLRAGRQPTGMHSLHRASRQPLPPLATPSTDARAARERTLVVVDEAHALRNAATARYRHVAHAVSGCDVLLLSATPLHNTPHDLAALFALFRGPHGDTVPGSLLATLVVRRRQEQIRGNHGGSPAQATSDRAAHEGRRASPPKVRAHRPLTVPQQRGTLERLLALPAPLPARDGAVAGALIRLGLLRAWCSSDAALTQALTRRLQRGTALRDALDAGRHPSHAELSAWLIGDDASGDMELAFAELLSPPSADSGAQRTALEQLAGHCDALRMLREFHVAHARADAVRAGYLRAIRARHPGTPIVAFSQHARTVQALFRALSDIAGVGMLTGSQARIASGRVTRPELLGWFAPRAQGRPPPPSSLRVDLLLTTDLIAEGVNLQDAGVVVHLDLPWTHALQSQRTGRVVRIGSPHAVAHEYRIRAARAVRRVIRAEQVVAQKAALAARLVGDGRASPTIAHRSAVEHAMRWELRLWQWALDATPAADHHRSSPRSARIASAGVSGAIVLARTSHSTCVLACVLEGRRWWVSTRADALLALSNGERPSRKAGRLRPPAADPATPLTAAMSRAVGRAVRAWSRQQRALEAAGTATTTGTENARHEDILNQAQRHALTWLQRRVASLSAVERARHATSIREAQAMITGATDAGAAAALRAWTDAADAADPRGWRDTQPLPTIIGRPPASGRSPVAAGHAPAAVRVEACLWVWPP